MSKIGAMARPYDWDFPSWEPRTQPFVQPKDQTQDVSLLTILVLAPPSLLSKTKLILRSIT